jgi:beta-phosphoglucomutase
MPYEANGIFALARRFGVLKAVIFDFDGVIVDSEKAHLAMFKKVLAEEGIQLTDEQYYEKYLAMDDRGCFLAVLTDNQEVLTNRQELIERQNFLQEVSTNQQGLDEAYIQSLVSRKSKYYNQFARDNLPLLPGVADFISSAHAHGLALAVASGALRNEIEFILDKYNLRRYFHAVISAEDCTKGKPDPEPFLTALERLRALRPELQASNCLAIEDSFHGIRAAKAAGMKCLAVTTSYPAERLAEADRVVPSLEAVTIEELNSLF